MAPNAGSEPTGAIATVINDVFGNFENFKTQFNDAGAKHFGSGFVWLVRTVDNKFEIISQPNQDCPWSDGHYPRCLGTCLLPHLSEPPSRIPEAVVEYGELGCGESALCSSNPLIESG